MKIVMETERKILPIKMFIKFEENDRYLEWCFESKLWKKVFLDEEIKFGKLSCEKDICEAIKMKRNLDGNNFVTEFLWIKL